MLAKGLARTAASTSGSVSRREAEHPAAGGDAGLGAEQAVLHHHAIGRAQRRRRAAAGQVEIGRRLGRRHILEAEDPAPNSAGRCRAAPASPPAPPRDEFEATASGMPAAATA